MSNKFAIADIVFIDHQNPAIGGCHSCALVVVAVFEHIVVGAIVGHCTHLVEHRVVYVELFGREGVAQHLRAAHSVRAQLPVGADIVVLRRREHVLPVGALVGHAAERVVGHVAGMDVVQPYVRQAVQVVVCEGLFQVAQVVCSGG